MTDDNHSEVDPAPGKESDPIPPEVNEVLDKSIEGLSEEQRETIKRAVHLVDDQWG